MTRTFIIIAESEHTDRIRMRERLETSTLHIGTCGVISIDLRKAVDTIPIYGLSIELTLCLSIYFGVHVWIDGYMDGWMVDVRMEWLKERNEQNKRNETTEHRY